MTQYVIRVWREGASPIASRFDARDITWARKIAREYLVDNGITLNAPLHTRKGNQIPASYEGGAAFVDLFIPSDIR